MNDKLRDAMDHISDRYLAEAAAPIRRRRYYPYIAAIAAILVLVLTLGVFLGPWKQEQPTPSPSGNPVLQVPVDTTGPTTPTTEEMSDASSTKPAVSTTTRPFRPTYTTTGPNAPTTDELPSASSTSVVSTTTRPPRPTYTTTEPNAPTTSRPSRPTYTTVHKPPTMKPTTTCTSTARVPTTDTTTSTTRPAYSTTKKPTAQTSTTPAPQPTIASVTTDKTVYTVNEFVHFTISSDGASTALRIYRVDGQWEETWQNVGSSFVYNFGSEGEYKAFVTTRNGSSTLTSAEINFTITNAGGILSPTYASLSTDKDLYTLGETVNFTMSSDGEINALWIYKPDGTSEYFTDVGTAYTYTPTLVGEYRVSMEAWLGATFCSPEEISFRVVDPTVAA